MASIDKSVPSMREHVYVYIQYIYVDCVIFAKRVENHPIRKSKYYSIFRSNLLESLEVYICSYFPLSSCVGIFLMAIILSFEESDALTEKGTEFSTLTLVRHCP